MIVCPNCKHENPEGATNCEACYTALPATKACPACGASIQLDATFCGQCGHSLKPAHNKSSPILLPPPAEPLVNFEAEAATIGLPPTVLTSPELEIPISSQAVVAPNSGTITPIALTPDSDSTDPPEELSLSLPVEQVEHIVPVQPVETVETVIAPVNTPPQTSPYQLLHLQTTTTIAIPPQLQVVNIGKPNDQVAPDIDVSALPCAEVVSRIHANIRVEGENYYIEDVGSANGTYINHNVLAKGNRHLLRPGDRIGLGKGDLVTFLFSAV
ncbi:FHA domain-containing protein [Chamaesiphon sp. VAR_48_metabat_135_sub]|uniref:FHA domain-containing protein n=1 Tax=Chamaesiphon sp. VAR_48_metabat_135_sub TaxID=2964699 RepID=UPI00286D29AF|nr:FHA domain-containing protein [Chamaesiphon sp. VAR_48_metabat_135_sub]